MIKVDQGAKYIVADPGDRDVARVRCREELLHGDTGDNLYIIGRFCLCVCHEK